MILIRGDNASGGNSELIASADIRLDVQLFTATVQQPEMETIGHDDVRLMLSTSAGTECKPFRTTVKEAESVLQMLYRFEKPGEPVSSQGPQEVPNKTI